MGKAEGYVEQYLVKQSEKFGYLCHKWMSSVRGVPDRIFIGNGHTVFIETKSDQGHLRKQQEFRINELRKRGADVRVIYTRDQVDAFLSEISQTKNTP